MAGSMVFAIPAAAAPPAPVTDVHVSSDVDGDGQVFATISWTQQDPNAAGARVCGKEGTKAPTAAYGCNVEGESDQSSVRILLRSWTTYTFSVFAYSGEGQQREFSTAVTTRPWHGTVLAIRECSAPLYGEPCRVETWLTDTHTHDRLKNTRVALYEGDATSSPAWHEYDADRTNSNGVAHVPVTLRRAHHLQWRFAGSDGILAGASYSDLVYPGFKVTGHLTSSSAHVGQKVKFFGTVHPVVARAVAHLYYEGHLGVYPTGVKTEVRKRRLPTGRTAYGYVLTVPTDSRGTTRYTVIVNGDPDLGSGISPERTLTVS